MANDDMSEFHRLLRGLGVCQAQINAELAKAKPDQAKIAVAFAAGKTSPGMPRRTVTHRATTDDGRNRKNMTAICF